MIGRRETFVLALLPTLAFCAFAAQTASAAGEASKLTTAFTCIKVTTPKTGDFDDIHCDTKNAKHEGEYTHLVIPLKETTAITLSADKTKSKTTEPTSTVLKGIFSGIAIEITCTTSHGEGLLHNEEPKPKVHNVTGFVGFVFSNCTVQKPANCTVGNIEMETEFQGVEGLGEKGDEMGVEYKPAGGGAVLTTIVLEGEKCLLAKKPIQVEGTMIGTGTSSPKEKWSGATQNFTAAMTSQTLKVGGNSAELTASLTLRMAPIEGKEQDPIGTTTT